ncbi:MAG TPA: hypothetical protein V6C78_00405 [Crinalium sp.]|jgi:hypothetical protein
MKTDDFNTTTSTTEERKELNKKVSVEYIVSVSLGVITIIVLAATAYYSVFR